MGHLKAQKVSHEFRVRFCRHERRATKDHIEAGRRAPQTGAGGLAARLAAGDERDHTFAGETQSPRDRVF